MLANDDSRQTAVRALLALALPLLLLGCGDTPERPLADGYTLHGVVLDAGTGAPVSGVDVQLGLEPKLEFHPFAVTDNSGGFLFKPAPATAPSIEVFRFEKAGYVSLDVPARAATRLEEYRYRLEVHIEPIP